MDGVGGVRLTQITLTELAYILGSAALVGAMFYVVGFSNGFNSKNKRGGSDE